MSESRPESRSSAPAPHDRPRVLSGIRPTGAAFQLGNYLGAVRHWAAMQDEAECFFFLADLHALTELPEPDQLRSRTRGSAAELLAMGVDPARSAVFAQSHLPEHAELAWVLGCLTGFGEASRMTQFKEKGGGSVGLFTYPVLQAADILMYQADAVPIGEDQRQHLGGADPGQLVERLRGDAVPAGLVAREVGPVEQQHPRVGTRPQRRHRRRRARRSGADDRDVPDVLHA